MNRLIAVLRLKRAWIPLALFVVYALFGFLVLPGILRGQIVSGIRQNLKREASLAKVRVNPLYLSLTLHGFELKDPDGTPFVSFDRLHLDFQLSSLVRWAYTFREFRLDGPRIHLRLMPDGQPNFMDLVPKEEGKPPRLVIGRFQIHDGAVRVTNLMAAEPEEGTFAPITLTLENFATIPQKEGLYRISAKDQGNGAWQWTGDLTFEPMHSSGVLEISGSRMRGLWEIAKYRVGFEVTGGQLGCRLQYAVDVRGDSLIARVHDSSLTLAGFSIREKGKEPDVLKLDSLNVSGIDVRYPEQAASVARVLLAGTRVKAWLNPDTTLNWLAVLAPPGSAPAAAKAPASSPAAGGGAAAGAGATPAASADTAATAPAPEWTLTLGELAVRDLGVDFEDRTTEPTFAVAVAPVNVTLRNVSSRPGATFDLATDFTIAGKGRLDVTGKVAAQPPAADVAVRLADLPLPIFQPYINPVAKLQLVSGTLGVAGDVRFREGTPQPDVRFKGKVSSHGFLARDRIANDRFLAWKSADVSAIDYAPARVSVGTVRLEEPFAKLLIHRDRTTNVQDILGIAPVDSAAAVAAAQPAAKGKKGKKPAKPQPKASEALAAMQHQAAAAAPPLPVKIGTVEVVNGSADFADLSLILPFAARLEGLAGTVTGLSSDSAARAAVTIDGRMQPSGTAQVRGEMNPLAQVPYLDLGVVFRGFNLPVLTPYAGQFLGREIDKGNMALDLGYRLEGRHLVGENKIVLDQLELGKKVESPEATRLPVGLALAILKDKNGVIDLDVPVEGDLDDPKFRIGRVILDFLMSLLKKVATAPFALLGALIPGGGGGEELSQVAFEVGASAVPEDQEASLGKLAEALGNRPQLGLEVRGRSDQNADATAIRKAKFKSLAGERMASDPKKYGGGLGYPPRLLEDLYVERFGKKGLESFAERHLVRAGELPQDHPQYKSGSKKLVVNGPVMQAAIRDTLTALQTVNESDLLTLANARANAIKQRLMEQGVAEARLYVLDPEPGTVENGRIRIELTLTD